MEALLLSTLQSPGYQSRQTGYSRLGTAVEMAYLYVRPAGYELDRQMIIPSREGEMRSELGRFEQPLIPH